MRDAPFGTATKTPRVNILFAHYRMSSNWTRGAVPGSISCGVETACICMTTVSTRSQ